MKILIACEYSGTVRDAFAAKGHEAWSLDLLPSETPGNHIQGDVVEHLASVESGFYDFIGLHFPCTEIALCGNRFYGVGMPKHFERRLAIGNTKAVFELCKRKAAKGYYENPKNVMGKFIGKRTQAVHPYEFGHMEQKETWLWLWGLPDLVGTDNVYDEMMKLPKKDRERIFFTSPGPTRGLERSRTFPGIAAAMADQWG